MANRIIKDTVNESEGLSECSVFADDLYKRLITYADDYGRFNSDTVIMRARLYPREYEYITERDIVDGLIELTGVGKVSFYTAVRFNQGSARSGVYGVFPNWSSHQRVRESKAKCPEPDDTDVNDWYLRRFVPIDMKAEIIERDNFKCQECNKFVTSCKEPKRFAKLGHGLFHIDHIVPCVQGGRATLENLRLTCPECNLKRKKQFSFSEILEFSASRDSAATCGDLRPHARVFENPIQSESESESNPNPREGVSARAPHVDFSEFISAYNELCQNLPAVKLLTEKRKTAIRAFSKQLGVEQFREACQKADASAFCAGENDRGWKADFDFLIRPDKAASVLEGKYDNREGSGSRAGPASNTGASSGKSGTDWGIEPDISV